MMNNNADPMMINNNMNPNIGMNPMMMNNDMNNPQNLIMMNPMLNNMNTMRDSYQEILNRGKKLYGIRVIMGNMINTKFVYNELDKASIIREKCNINEGSLIHNYRLINENLSLMENNIHYGATIEVKTTKLLNLKFKSPYGELHNITLSEDCPLSIALLHYYINEGNPLYLQPLLNGKARLKFIFNASILNNKDETPIGKCFENFGIAIPLITVVD